MFLILKIFRSGWKIRKILSIWTENIQYYRPLIRTSWTKYLLLSSFIHQLLYSYYLFYSAHLYNFSSIHISFFIVSSTYFEDLRNRFHFGWIFQKWFRISIPIFLKTSSLYDNVSSSIACTTNILTYIYLCMLCRHL